MAYDDARIFPVPSTGGFHSVSSLLRFILVLLLLPAGALGAEDVPVSPFRPGPVSAETDPLDGITARIDNVFIIVIDGLRNSEAFDDPTHRYIPNIWNRLRPLGTIYEKFQTLGKTATTPGHAAMTSGVVQLNHNRVIMKHVTGLRQNDPSIFQYYRTQLGVPGNKTWSDNGKGPMIDYTGVCLHPAYKDDFAPAVSFASKRPDDETFQVSKTVIKYFHPSLTLINFEEVDGMGHSGVWLYYTWAIRRADKYVYDLCTRILNDPVYRGNTAIIITSDHGRHLDNVSTGFQSHGCCCLGCREVPFLILGPGIRKGAVVNKPGALRDIAPTVAAMLGFKARYAEGRILREVFEAPIPERNPSHVYPAVAVAEGIIHVAFGARSENGSGLWHIRSTDNGKNWTPPLLVSSASNNIRPGLSAQGDKVGLAWTSLHPDGSWKLSIRESEDRGRTWSPEELLRGSYNLFSDINVDLCYRNGALHVVWTEIRQTSLVHAAVLKEMSLQNRSFLVTSFAPWARSAPSDRGIHLVIQRMAASTVNWNICYSHYDGVEILPPVPLCNTADQSLEPDIASDRYGAHIVWAERESDTFRIVCRNSKNGIDWDTVRVVGENRLGAWRPRIAATDDAIAVVWEGHDGTGAELFCSTSRDRGQTWSPSVRLSGAVGENTRPAAAIDGAGRLHVLSMKGEIPRQLEYTNRQL